MVRTIQTNPTDPTLRFELGTVYATLQNYEQAVRLFQQTIELKPDWANAYYNLANAYKQRGDNASALSVLQQTRQLIPADSADLVTLI
jgi:tetratricopeptide (TPR) repeat protein